jgi:phosphate transport system substrate-binding protein
MTKKKMTIDLRLGSGFGAVLVLLFVSATLVFLPQGAMGSEGISYSGSSTVGTGVLEAGAIEAFETKTKVRFTSIEQPGSGKGIKALLDGRVNLAGASRPLKRKEKKQKLLAHVIGYDAIAIFIHVSNPIDNLTKEQLKGIFTGRITNWKEVGGKDAAITPNTEILGDKRATALEFQKLAMDGEPYGKGFTEIDYPKDQIVQLAGEETGICTVSIGLLSAVRNDVQSRVKVIAVNGVEPSKDNIHGGKYLIFRPLLLITKGLPGGDVKKFIDFMRSRVGQDIVTKNFVSVK